MVRPRGWRKQRSRHGRAARKGWDNRKARRSGAMIQTGRSNRAIDRKLHARVPGKRTSYRGKKYIEYRENRSDAKPRTGL